MSTPKIRVRVDGRELFNGQAGEWISRPPDVFRDAIRPDAVPEPWMKAIMITLADTVTLQKGVKINVRTKINGWSMEVTDS